MKRYTLLMAAAMALACPTGASARVRVVAATADLGQLAMTIGGDLVDVDIIARGNRDLHYIEVLPSHMLKLRRADIYLAVGFELDLWSQRLIDGSRNNDLLVVDCSQGIAALEIPSTRADARYGDIHRFGNPHYWLSPDNIPIICETIFDALIQVDAENRRTYSDNRDRYLAALADKVTEWDALRDRLGKIRFIAYHNTWPYLCTYFGCRTVGFVEEYPGVAPSPSHLARLKEQIQKEAIPLVAYEPFHDKRTPNWLARETGCRAAVLPASIGGVDGADSYFALIDTIVKRLLAGDEHDD